jgi:uncharacterized iron-regulated protein
VADPNHLEIGDPARRQRVVAVEAGAIMDTRRGDVVTPDQLAERLDGVRLVLVGETHASPSSQSAELQVLQALERRGRPVLVGLEMLPASVQPALDRWTKGEGTEEELLRASHWYQHWGFHFGHYRPIFLFARDKKAPMVALNVEREVITSVRKQGLDGLAPEQRAKLPARIDLDSPEHRQLFEAMIGPVSGPGAGGHGGMTPEMMDGMFRAQCTWDAVMGWNAVRALQAHPDPRAVMVVLVGVGHVAYGLGAQRQAALHAPAPLPAAAVAVLRETDEEGQAQTVRASYAEFIWGAPAEDGPPPFPSLGVTLADKPGSGPTISAVKPGSPAARAGIQVGDAVAAVDGQAVADKESFSIELGKKAWGDRVTIEVVRQGQKQALSAALEREPEKPGPAPAPAGGK